MQSNVHVLLQFVLAIVYCVEAFHFGLLRALMKHVVLSMLWTFVSTLTAIYSLNWYKAAIWGIIQHKKASVWTLFFYTLFPGLCSRCTGNCTGVHCSLPPETVSQQGDNVSTAAWSDIRERDSPESRRRTCDLHQVLHQLWLLQVRKRGWLSALDIRSNCCAFAFAWSIRTLPLPCLILQYPVRKLGHGYTSYDLMKQKTWRFDHL